MQDIFDSLHDPFVVLDYLNKEISQLILGGIDIRDYNSYYTWHITSSISLLDEDRNYCGYYTYFTEYGTVSPDYKQIIHKELNKLMFDNEISRLHFTNYDQ